MGGGGGELLASTAPASAAGPGMGVKRSLQSGVVLLGILAHVLTVLSTASNYWTRFPGGHSGLWQECKGGVCPNMPCQSEAPPPPPPPRPIWVPAAPPPRGPIPSDTL